MEKYSVVIIAGTTRKQRKSIHAARFVEQIGNRLEDVEITFVDPSEFNLPGDGNDPEGKDPRYTEITSKADAFFIVVPEYNHSFPGSLKRLLDSELKNYIHKPVTLAGVSSGVFGGARAIEALLSPLREMGMVVTFSDVYFMHSYDLFNDNGEMVEDKKEEYEKRVEKAYKELLWMTKSLKYGREEL